MDRRSSIERDVQAMAAMTELTRADDQYALDVALALCALAREAARGEVTDADLLHRLREYGRVLGE